ncbi:MAG: hypothetical protein AAFU81_01565 [Pseudomonadota bacterium]
MNFLFPQSRDLGTPIGALVGGGISAPGFNYYVDSVSGSDANDGTSEAQAFASFAPALAAVSANDSVGLLRGSTWEEEWDTGILGRVDVSATGSGAMPVIDGASVIASWTAEGTANVYEATVDHNATGNERLTVYAPDGSLMTRVDNVAACSSTPGSFVGLRASDGDPWVVQIHATDSTDPSGKGYAVSHRRRCIFADNGSVIQGPFKLQRNASNGGPLHLANDVTARQILSVNGTKHNVVVGSGTLEDVIACRADTTTSYEVSSTWFVGYDIDATGLDLTMKRCAVVPDGFDSGGSALIMHDSTGNPYDTFVGEQLWGIDCGIWTPTALDVSINGFYGEVNSSNLTSSFGAYLDAGTFRYIQMNHAASGAGQAFGHTFYGASSNTATRTITFQDMVFYSLNSNTRLLRLWSALNGATLVFRNCVFYMDGFRSVMDEVGGAWNTGALTIENCIFAYPSNGNPVRVPTGITYTGNNNVFLDGSVGATSLNCRFNGTLYTTLAAWQTATGQDANSLHFNRNQVSELFSGAVADGDFRLGTTGAGASAAAISAGPQFHWDWNTRAAVAGPPEAWPTVPKTLSDCEDYTIDPAGWDHYPLAA